MSRHFRHSILVALFSVLSLGSAPALSQDAGGYAGFNFGQSKGKDVCGTGSVCDDKDTALSVFGGYQFNRNFAVEVGYTDLGKFTETIPGFVTASFEASGFEVSGVGTIPINQQFSLYGKMGLFLWDADLKGNVLGFPVSTSDDGVDLTFALGARYSFTKNLALQMQWQRYNDVGDNATTGKFDFDVIGVGLLFRF